MVIDGFVIAIGVGALMLVVGLIDVAIILSKRKK